MFAAIVMVITMAVPLQVQDTTAHKDSTSVQPPTIEQIRYMEGLKTVTRGVTQVREGLNRVTRAQQADSLRRRRAARMLGGFCGTARTFIVSGRPKMQASAYADSLRILAKQLTTRLKNYDDALTAFRAAQAAQGKPDSTKVSSSQ